MIGYYKYLIGGALIGALLITSSIFNHTQNLQAQLPGISRFEDTTHNISDDLGDVDKNDNPPLLVTGGDNDGDTTTPTPMSPTLSPSLKMSPSPTPKISPSPSVSPKASLVQKLSTAKTSGKVLINEIAWAGTGASATDEWLELYNEENEPIDISGWRLVAQDGSPDITFKDETVIDANSYFLIERTEDSAISGLTADLAVSFGNGLNNNGEVLWLINAEGIPADSAGKTGEKWPAGDATAKLSMERNGADWKSFSGSPTRHDAKGNLVHGTPKGQNSPIQVAVTTPTPSPSLSPTPTPTPSPTPTTTPTPEPADDSVVAGSVVINEIAWMGTATSSNDEWLELYNTTGETVNLDGWTLKATDGTPNITLSGNIGPFGFYLLERTDDTTVSDILADKNPFYTGALDNDGEYLELRNVANEVIDFIDASAGWLAGDNTTKSSMERTESQGSGNDPANWHTNDGMTKNGLDAEGNAVNGTPRSQNSH